MPCGADSGSTKCVSTIQRGMVRGARQWSNARDCRFKRAKGIEPSWTPTRQLNRVSKALDEVWAEVFPRRTDKPSAEAGPVHILRTGGRVGFEPASPWIPHRQSSVSPELKFRRGRDQRTPLARRQARLAAPPQRVSTPVGFEPTSSCEHQFQGLQSGSRKVSNRNNEVMARVFRALSN